MGDGRGIGWTPGQPRVGRPKLTTEEREARALLRASIGRAIHTLLESLTSDDENMRIKAASILLAKGLPDVVVAAGIEGVSDDELLAEIDRRAAADADARALEMARGASQN